MRADEFEAITIDALGTTVELEDPVSKLAGALAERGVERDHEAVAAAFRAEVAHYLPRAHLGGDTRSLHDLQVECVGVFLAAAQAPLPADEFLPAFAGSLRFRPLPGVPETLGRLRAAGLALACVSNWDVTLESYLRAAGLAEAFDVVVSSASAGAPKPDPAPLRLALRRLGVPPEKALHVGDSESDREAAQAAGVGFAPTPLVTLPARLGLHG